MRRKRSMSSARSANKQACDKLARGHLGTPCSCTRRTIAFSYLSRHARILLLRSAVSPFLSLSTINRFLTLRDFLFRASQVAGEFVQRIWWLCISLRVRGQNDDSDTIPVHQYLSGCSSFHGCFGTKSFRRFKQRCVCKDIICCTSSSITTTASAESGMAAASSRLCPTSFRFRK